MSTDRLAGKVCLVTGGSRGIGAAIVNRLAGEGGDVVFTRLPGEREDRATAEVLDRVHASGRRGSALVCDQGDPDAVGAMVEDVVAAEGRIDVLVVNAGIAVNGRVDDPTVSLTDLKRQLDVNLFGVVATVRHAVAHMPDGGRIIAISSNGATHVPVPGMAEYCATKAGVVALVRGWSRDLGPRGVTVNAVLPGPTDTDLNPVGGEHHRILLPRIPLGRYGRPEEVAGAVAFLAGPDATFITGSTVAVDGGSGA